tara:strand:+ start:1869 stop:3290 length:1422 start_codon:yes stop_codon:yes gene_type:complete
MKRAAKIISIFSLIILISLGVQKLIQYQQLPDSITFATGREGGRYLEIAKALGARIERDYGVKVQYVESAGSIENIRSVNSGEVQFALFQSNAVKSITKYPDVRTVANVFPEVIIAHVRKGLGFDPFLEGSGDGKLINVSMGEKDSGNAVTSHAVLEFFEGHRTRMKPHYLNYEQTKQKMKDGSIDLALITTEKNASIQQEMTTKGETDIMELPLVASLLDQNPEFDSYSIPAGFYGVHPKILPSQETSTVAVNAQLICNKNVSPSMATLVTEILMDPEFISSQGLTDLRLRGNEYAISGGAIPTHEGAIHFFEPELKPPLNPDFVEATEGMRSFLVSIIIAFYFIFQWGRKRKQIRSGHHLDSYLHQLLDIENDQMKLDEGGASEDEILKLEDFLDEVTKLRQEALSSFSANDFNHDSGFECFILMSNSLTEKINAKLTRQRLCKQISTVGDRIVSKGNLSKSHQPLLQKNI